MRLRDRFKFFLGACDVVFANFTQAVEVVLGFAADVSQSNPSLLGFVANNFYKLPAALLGQFRQRRSNNNAVVADARPEVRRACYCLLDFFEGGLVERRDDERARFLICLLYTSDAADE